VLLDKLLAKGDAPEVRDDVALSGFAVEWERAGGGGWDGNSSTQFASIEEARLLLLRRLQILWCGSNERLALSDAEALRCADVEPSACRQLTQGIRRVGGLAMSEPFGSPQAS
jgi:hypothetical protein